MEKTRAKFLVTLLPLIALFLYPQQSKAVVMYSDFIEIIQKATQNGKVTRIDRGQKNYILGILNDRQHMGAYSVTRGLVEVPPYKQLEKDLPVLFASSPDMKAILDNLDSLRQFLSQRQFVFRSDGSAEIHDMTPTSKRPSRISSPIRQPIESPLSPDRPQSPTRVSTFDATTSPIRVNTRERGTNTIRINKQDASTSPMSLDSLNHGFASIPSDDTHSGENNRLVPSRNSDRDSRKFSPSSSISTHLSSDSSSSGHSKTPTPKKLTIEIPSSPSIHSFANLSPLTQSPHDLNQSPTPKIPSKIPSNQTSLSSRDSHRLDSPSNPYNDSFESYDSEDGSHSKTKPLINPNSLPNSPTSSKAVSPIQPHHDSHRSDTPSTQYSSNFYPPDHSQSIDQNSPSSSISTHYSSDSRSSRYSQKDSNSKKLTIEIPSSPSIHSPGSLSRSSDHSGLLSPVTESSDTSIKFPHPKVPAKIPSSQTSLSSHESQRMDSPSNPYSDSFESYDSEDGSHSKTKPLINPNSLPNSPTSSKTVSPIQSPHDSRRSDTPSTQYSSNFYSPDHPQQKDQNSPSSSISTHYSSDSRSSRNSQKDSNSKKLTIEIPSSPSIHSPGSLSRSSDHSGLLSPVTESSDTSIKFPHPKVPAKIPSSQTSLSSHESQRMDSPSNPYSDSFESYESEDGSHSKTKPLINPNSLPNSPTSSKTVSPIQSPHDSRRSDTPSTQYSSNFYSPDHPQQKDQNSPSSSISTHYSSDSRSSRNSQKDSNSKKLTIEIPSSPSIHSFGNLSPLTQSSFGPNHPAAVHPFHSPLTSNSSNMSRFSQSSHSSDFSKTTLSTRSSDTSRSSNSSSTGSSFNSLSTSHSSITSKSSNDSRSSQSSKSSSDSNDSFDSSTSSGSSDSNTGSHSLDSHSNDSDSLDSRFSTSTQGFRSHDDSNSSMSSSEGSLTPSRQDRSVQVVQDELDSLEDYLKGRKKKKKKQRLDDISTSSKSSSRVSFSMSSTLSSPCSSASSGSPRKGQTAIANLDRDLILARIAELKEELKDLSRKMKSPTPSTREDSRSGRSFPASGLSDVSAHGTFGFDFHFGAEFQGGMNFGGFPQYYDQGHSYYFGTNPALFHNYSQNPFYSQFYFNPDFYFYPQLNFYPQVSYFNAMDMYYPTLNMMMPMSAYGSFNFNIGASALLPCLYTSFSPLAGGAYAGAYFGSGVAPISPITSINPISPVR